MVSLDSVSKLPMENDMKVGAYGVLVATALPNLDRDQLPLLLSLLFLDFVFCIEEARAIFLSDDREVVLEASLRHVST